MQLSLTTPKDDHVALSLTDLLAKSPYTLFYFYPKDDTPGCTLEAQDFTHLRAKFAEQEVQVVGVSKDDGRSHCKFRDKFGLSIDLVSDPDYTLHHHFSKEGFELVGEKSMYGKVYTGTIRSSILVDTA